MAQASVTARNGQGGSASAGPDGLAAIRIRGARQNNLEGVDVDIPRDRLVAITGVSGSGKSSLAFDTLFREGQRRFLETLSAYARQFLGRMEKPAVDSVEGLSPAIAVDQKAIQRGPRSTVGTLTEIVDHLRVLFARAGTARCPEHGEPLEAQTPESVVERIGQDFDGALVHVLAPVIRGRKGQHKALLADLSKRGYVRVRVDGEVARIEEVPELERYKLHTIEVVVDRLRVDAAEPARLREAVLAAIELGAGDLSVLATQNEEERGFATQRTCSTCGFEAPPLEPRLFSFNSPHGSCPDCDGLGVSRRPTEARIVTDPSMTIREGCLAVTRASGGALLFPRVSFGFLESVGAKLGFDLDTPWRELPAEARSALMYGTVDARFEDVASWSGERVKGSYTWKRRFRGVIPALERAVEKGTRRKFVERFLDVSPCATCEGTRVNETARSVTVGGKTFGELTRGAIDRLDGELDALEEGLDARGKRIARDLLLEVRRRLDFLREVGLAYLSLDRSADTLSGGEAQRIRLAAQLGAGLQGVLYVLDEPSIGLHERDQGRLLDALRALRDGGNTVVVVEHDEATLRAADHLIEIGPGAGRHGGRVVAAGAPADIARADSPTGRLLRGELAMPAPEQRRPGNGDALVVRGARGFNLQGDEARFPLGTLAVVSGVSGSGKSTLVNATLARTLRRHLGLESPLPAENDGVDGLDAVEELVDIDATPLGRTPRSNPATYTGAATAIRDLFASLPEARMRGWTPGRFSFNVAGGRCESCQGAGSRYIELQFLAPVTVPCEECGGHRFQEETLEVRYKGASIADVLDMPIEDAHELFREIPKIARPLSTLVEVGLGYLRLGQPSTTLSGGEAQRVKLAKYLQRRSRKHTLYLLDEPTTGLHQQDVQRLVGALQRLVDAGNSVLVIEHNLEVIGAADHVLDLGPEGGRGGGHIIAQGTPEELREVEASHTGQALARMLTPARRRKPGGARKKAARPAPAPDRLTVRGARTHNLRGIDVDLPRDALTVVTGPSGSGKSSLALDTIHALGRQRFVESLSTYARQFLTSRDRPPVDRIEGLGPSVAVEARTSVGHPRSTVATTTEIHDLLRVLWARAGVRRCPEHGTKLERGDASKVVRQILGELEGERGWLLAPIFGPGVETPADLPAAFAEARTAWIGAGFARVLVDGEELRLDAGAELPRGTAPDARVDLVVDRVAFKADDRSRLADGVEQAESIAGGRVSALVKTRSGPGRRLEFSTRGACPTCGFSIAGELEPRHFSFNAHVGACPECDGLGVHWQCDPEKLVDHPKRPLIDPEGGETAIQNKLGRYLTKGKGYYEHLLRAVGRAHRIDLTKPFAKLSATHRELLLFGVGAREQYDVKIEKQNERFELEEEFTAGWPGLCGHVEAWHTKSEDPGWRQLLEKFLMRTTCRACNGERLGPAPRNVTVGRKRLPEMLRMAVDDALAWLDKLKLAAHRAEAVEPVLEELRSRLGLVHRVGLGYLTLDRSMGTLSGGEARRIRLSASLGSQLVGVCYVLDEPTVGLHPADIDRLTDALLALRDGGNTVLVVEHDEAVMRRADHLIDIGPGSGRHGGTVVVSGTPDEVEACADSPTGRALRGEFDPAERVADDDGAERPPRDRVRIRGANLHNLRKVTFEAAYGELTGVCGPSGSGKSTLVLDSLVPALKGEKPAGRWSKVEGHAGRVVVIDAAPLGRTPASVPATAVGLLDPLRELFARLPEARMRGFGPSHFSFNSHRGRCPACKGRGSIQVEMQFLADLWLECEECGGKRYRPDVLEVRLRGYSVAELLALSAEEARDVLAHQPVCARILGILCDVGLGYLPLDQSSTTLSAGEAQRVKLAGELLRAEAAGRSVVVLDEPSTGLHASDVAHLATVLGRLADRGDAVIVIEHHTGLLRACDRLVELGPGGGEAGGRIVASGTPRELAGDSGSVTGPWLGPRSRDGAPPSPSGGRRGRRGRRKEIAL